MTLHRGLYVALTAANVGTTPLEARLAMAGTLAESSAGVPRSGLLRQSATNVVTGVGGAMRYSVGPCTPVVNRDVGEGVYVFSLTGSTTVDTTVSPASGSRYDLIWVKQNDVTKNDPDNLPVLGVTQGAAASSPARPYASVPAGALVLAEALIPANVTGTTAAGVTITQLWLHTAARGAPIAVRSASERDSGNASPKALGLTAYDGLQVIRLDRYSTLQRYGGGRWFGVQEQSGRLTVPAISNGGSHAVDPVTMLSGIFSGTPDVQLTSHSSRVTASVDYNFSTTGRFRAVFDNRSGASANGGVASWHASYQLTD